MEKDYYQTLGIEKNASEQDIRKAFLKMSKKYHPDMQSGKSDAEKKEAEEKFKEINEANEVLSNKEKRANYDRFGTANGMNGGFGAGGIDPREFFRKMHKSGHFGSFGGFNPFGDESSFSFGGNDTGTSYNPNSPKNGRDVKISIKLPLEDILYGTKKEFSINIKDPCEDCHGTGSENGEMEKCPICHGTGYEVFKQGFMISRSTCRNCGGIGHVIKTKCPKCNGTGIKLNRRNLNVTIPKGFQEGGRLRIKGEGEHGVNGGANGNLYIDVYTDSHNIFERHENDIVKKEIISPIVASIGGDIEITTPWGLKTIHIDSGIENGKTIKIPSYGIKNNETSGDLYVVIEVENLCKLNEEQKNILKKLENMLRKENLPNVEKCKEINKKFLDDIM